jgi:predicted O-methyltransferase YrrM
MATATLNLTPDLYAYYSARACREPAILAELRLETRRFADLAAMQIAPEQGAFMALLAGLIDARTILEIGTFTGYSSLAMALACNAHIVAIDVSEEWTSVARRYWAKAGVEDRLQLYLDGGAAGLDRLRKGGKDGTFDLVFIDADKENYDTYYEEALSLLRVGGLMLIDNVLWGGDVADPSKRDAETMALRRLNDKIKSDGRVDFCIVPIGDGLTMARKKLT